MAAMELGKHVFVQKPLAHNIWQVRTLRKAARRYGVITQMGNQGHTFEGMRRIKEWVAAGVIGDVYGGRHLDQSAESALVRAARELSPAHEPCAQRPGLGPVAGPRGRARVLSSLRADPVARMVGLRLRLAG